MSDGYDFFATGRPQVPPGSPTLPPPPVPAPPSAPPVDAVYNAPPPAAQFTRADGVTVNQFGTPIGAASAPTGPYAAPGVGAVPTEAPGMVSSWPGPQAAAAPAPYAGRRAAGPASTADRPPRNVVAVAVLALVFGALGALATLMGLYAYQETSNQLASLGGSSAFTDAIMTTLLIGLVIIAAVTALLLVGGLATLTGRRWGGWLLVASYSLYLLGRVQQMVASGFSLWDTLFALIALVLLLVLVTGEGLAWLRGARA